MGEAWADGLKSFVDHQHAVICKSTTIRTLWPARKSTATKDRWIGAYSIGLTIPGETQLSKQEKKNWYPLFCARFSLQIVIMCNFTA
jgi:hypothetical protein